LSIGDEPQTFKTGLHVLQKDAEVVQVNGK